MTGIIMAGGSSRRIGKNKALLPWGTSTLIETIVSIVSTVCDDVIVVSNIPLPMLAESVRVIPDIIPGKGPLGGIYTGLQYAKYDCAFVTACDMPYLVPDAISYLFDESPGWDSVMPSSDGYFEPLFACYSNSCLPVIESMLAINQLRVDEMLPKIRCRLIEQHNFRVFDPELNLFKNLNTLDDYEAALRFNSITRTP